MVTVPSAVDHVILFFIFIILSGVRLSPLGTEPTTALLYQTQMIDNGVVEQLVE
jgi:hypothetical protein